MTVANNSEVVLVYPSITHSSPDPLEDVTGSCGVDITLYGRSKKDTEMKDGSFPLIMFIGGYTHDVYQSIHHAENMASKGYIVAVIQINGMRHGDGWGSSMIANGKVQVVNTLTHLLQDTSLHIDASRIGTSCYSAGCMIIHNLDDDRIQARAMMSPFYVYNLKETTISPVLIVAGGAEVYPGLEAIKQREYFDFMSNTSSDAYYLELFGEAHNTFKINPELPETCNPTSFQTMVWDWKRLSGMVSHFMTAFFDLHVRNEAEAREYLVGGDWRTNSSILYKGLKPSPFDGWNPAETGVLFLS